MRQLRRVGRGDEGLEIVDQFWNSGQVDSAHIALDCAKVWYDNRRQRQGDLAIERAKELDPTFLPIYVEEAHNQRWRGNVSAALGAAEMALDLDNAEPHSKYWNLFIGELKFELGLFEEAVIRMREGLTDNASDEQRYKFGVALARIGEPAAAAAQFTQIETTVAGVDPALRRSELHFRHRNYPEVLAALQGTPDSDERKLLYSRSQLMLGNPEAVIEHFAGATPNGDLGAIYALAMELSSDAEGALGAYKLLIDPEDVTSTSRPIRRRAARAAESVGDHKFAVLAELQGTPTRVNVKTLLDEVHPDYLALAEAADGALKVGNFSEALPTLRQLAFSSSTRKNSRLMYRLLARCYAATGEAELASQAFFRVNKFRTPHAEESLESYSDLNFAELYSELWDTLPLAPKTVLYESFHGASTACNPLAICLELLEREEAAEFEHIWVIKKGTTVHPELLGRPNVHFVMRDSWGYYIHLASAQYLVNNTTFPPRFIRKPGQQYLNSWHGTPWKHLGRDIVEDPFGHDNAGRNFVQATHNVLPNEHTSKILVSTHDISNIITHAPDVIGSPRVDRTLNLPQARKDRITGELGLSGDRPVIFYAPTWRGALGALQLDAEPFVDAVEELASQDADVILRFHHLLTSAIDVSTLPSNVTVVPDDIDTNEVLAITDVLISDYSSLIFDFAPRNRPIVKYVFDLEQYSSERGLYFTVDEVPGEVCRTRAELGETLAKILSSADLTTDWSAAPLAHLWNTEDGNATERAIKLMFGEQEQLEDVPPSTTALISLSGLRANGVTRSLRNLMASSTERGFAVQLMVPKVSLDTEQARDIANELHENADMTLYTGLMTGTRQEVVVWRRLHDLRSDFPRESVRWIRSRMQRERQRYFSDARFGSAFDFDGYVAAQASLIGLGFPEDTRRVYVAHSEFYEEMISRFPKHRQIGAILDQFTSIASVSDGAMRRNQEDMESVFAVPASKHHTMPNTLDLQGILESSKEPLDADIAAWLEQPGFHVVIAARLSVEKNHEAVLRAMAQTDDSDSPVRLLLLGSGPRKVALEGLASDLGIADRIMFAGHRDNPYPAIAGADAMLLPSTHEGQGLVLFEAMLLGLPVAASNISGPASVLANGQYGMLVEPTVAGMKSALDALSSGQVAVSSLDLENYQQDAIQAFYGLTGN